MEPKDKAAALTEIIKVRMEKYRQTRDLEFKVNIALWTLIALVGYRGEKTVDLSDWSDYVIYGVAALVIVIGHYFFWLIPLSESMARDNARALELQKQVENIVSEKTEKPERSEAEIKRCYKEINLFLAGITLILLVLLGIYLAL